MTGKKLTSIFLILALLVDATGHSVAFGVGLRAHDGGTSKSVAAAPYIEDVFSSYLYTGNNSAQTITNGIDIAGRGGLVWIKHRGMTATNHQLADTNRTGTKMLASNSDNAENNTSLTFNNNGFSLATLWSNNQLNETYASWTFRKAPKFFDVVTYTGDGTSNRAISHALGIAPGMVIVKARDAVGSWQVYHRAIFPANSRNVQLHLVNAASDGGQDIWGNGITVTEPTVTRFYVSNSNNTSGATYVAYLFAHDASSSGVIQAGSAVVASADAVVNLGWEPQYVLYKLVDAVGPWTVIDSMRGLTANIKANNSRVFFANNSNLEETNNGPALTSTGFILPYADGNAHVNGTYIYLAIRRGPMRTPTSGTQVFLTNDGGGSITGDSVAVGFPVDAAVTAYKTLGGRGVNDRLRGFGTANSAGSSPLMDTSQVTAESGWSGSNPYFYNAWNTTILRGSNGADPGGGIVTWFFRRAPGVFDVAAFAGSDSNFTVNHSLGVIPELIILKKRGVSTGAWFTFSSYYAGGFGAPNANMYIRLNTQEALTGTGSFFTATPSSTVLSMSGAANYAFGDTGIAYLFATLPGVSKVGSYTGDGTAGRVISCGFTAGARFILIKRTDSTGNWFVWDSVRGIVAGNDPHFSLNANEGQVTTNDSVDPDSGGFVVNQDAATNINVNGGTYIYLAFQ